MLQKLLDIKDAERLLGVGHQAIKKLIRKGELNGKKVGRKWMFREIDIENFLKKRFNGVNGNGKNH